MSACAGQPLLNFLDDESSAVFDLVLVKASVSAALQAVLENAGPGERILGMLEQVDFVLVRDDEIRRVHREFCGDPLPTDVITFHHGEIVLGAETICRNAAEFHQEPWVELTRCCIHGLLHLNGHTDHEPEHAAQMRAVQEKILAAVTS
jgi:probable rRNA maturation factor